MAFNYIKTVSCKQIPINELQVGRWYVGRGRNANVGLWDGDCFLVIGMIGVVESWKPRKWVNTPGIKMEPYFTPEEGCFQPFLLVDEGIGVDVFEREYAKTLIFGDEGRQNIT